MTPEVSAPLRRPSTPDSGRVVVVGAINVDLVVAAERLPGAGETVVGGGLERHGGGKGANAAVAAARAGAAVRLIGAVGADDTGSATLADLRAEGVDVNGVAVLPDQPTGVALIVVDPDGENQIAVGAGANAAVTAEHVRRELNEALPGTGCVLVSTEISGEAIVAAVEAAAAAGVPCILNPAPVVPAVLDVLGGRDLILTPNRSELAELAGCLDAEPVVGGADPGPLRSDLRAAAERARRIAGHTGAPVAVTLGGDGALAVTPDGQVEHVPARPATVRDTTGAGDTFNGVLAARLAMGDGFGHALRTAVAAASLSVAHVGARAGMPTAELIDAAVERV